MSGPQVREAGYDLDLSDENCEAWNRLACGYIDEPAEMPLTAAAVLAVTAAEQAVLAEYVRILSLGWAP